MSSSDRNCKNCHRRKFNLSEASERFDSWSSAKKSKYTSSSSSHKSRRGHKDDKVKKDHIYSLLVKIEENIIIENHIHFDVGIGGNNVIEVSQDGSVFTFRKSGMYRIVFTGLVDLKTPDSSYIIFNKSDIKPEHIPFMKNKIYSGNVNTSTLLPFKKGQTLDIKISKSGRELPIVSGGSQLEIYKVSSI